MCKDLRDSESNKKVSSAANSKESSKESASTEKESTHSSKGCGCGGY